jgi:hypothetical protein
VDKLANRHYAHVDCPLATSVLEKEKELLLNDRIENNIVIDENAKSYQRRRLLRLLMRYYQLHVQENFLTFKS